MDRVREAVVSDYRRAWWDGEADAYERRNPNATGLQPRVLDAIAREVNPGDSILEVGCGSGANLRGIETRIQGRIACFGCDPSEIALENGQAKAPEHEFHRATSDALPYADSSFDLVLLSFVLHWVDPALLLRTVAEVDRVLRDKNSKRPGILAIADFAPDSPHSRPYRHHGGLKT